MILQADVNADLLLSEDDLERIYLESLPLYERLDLNSSFTENKETINRKHIWERKLTGVQSDFFKTRLKNDSISPKLLNKIISDVRVDKKFDYTKPEWLRLIKKVNKNAQRYNKQHKLSTKIPFQEILYPLTEFALCEIKKEVLTNEKRALRSIRKNLLIELSEFCAPVLLEEFKKLDDSYEDYVKKVISNNYKYIFLKYPVLTKNIGTIITRFVKNYVQLIKRFNKDTEFLKDIVGENPKGISEIESGLSDYHCGRNSVKIIVTESGRKVVYKPRRVLSEKYFYQLVDWINTNTKTSVKIPKISDMKQYGWMEYIPHKKCNKKRNVCKYYYNMGSVLCLYYVLGGTDGHEENLIANASNPVIIDTETLLNPHIKPNEKPLNKIQKKINDIYDESVIKTGIVPKWIPDNKGNVYDNSSIGSYKSEKYPYPKKVWLNINKKNMYYLYEVSKKEKQNNSVFLEDTRVDATNYSKYIIEGFSNTYRFFLKNKTELLKKTYLLNKIKVRYVFRPTKVYSLLLENIKHPDYNSKAILRDIELDIMSKGLVSYTNKRYKYWSLLKYEHHQLNSLDIPYFYTFANSRHLFSEGKKVVRNCFRSTSYKDLRRRIENLSERSLENQLCILNGSLEIRKEYNKSRIKSFNKVNKFTKSDYLNITENLAEKIINQGIKTSNSISWISYTTDALTHSADYRPVGLSLGTGNMGAALFLSALYKKIGKKIYKINAERALTPILEILKEEWSINQFLRFYGLGGTSGLGGIIYGLSKSSEFLENNKLLEYAKRFSNLLSEDLLNREVNCDFVSGISGLMSSLIYLYEKTKNPAYLDRAYNCSKRILEERRVAINGYNVWEYKPSVFLTGFSHGSSGILCSLAKVNTYKKSKNIEYAIKDALKYESFIYSEKENNWPDLRDSKINLNAVSWCHGAVGVGFSRLGILLRGFSTEEIKIDVERALLKTLESGIKGVDQLCCGNFGKIDFLITAGLILDRPKLVVQAEKLASDILSLAGSNMNFMYYPNLTSRELDIGMWQGASGIGYELLRILNPSEFSSMLLWE
ncbi:MAG: type 2 lanthipeptide synthetase LanM [Patescibacteria group bacterium]